MSGCGMEASRDACETALRRRWESEPREVAESYDRYCIEFECTYETFVEILAKIKAYPTAKRTYRMIPKE